MRILLIKHGGPGKARAVRTLQRVGEVHVADVEPALPVPGLHLLRVPSLTSQFVLAAIGRLALSFDAVLTYVDPAVPATARVAAAIGVPGIATQVAELLKDKAALRDRMSEFHLPCPAFARIAAETDLPQAADAVGFPAVLKPAGGAYSLGVRFVGSPEQLLPIFHSAATEAERGWKTQFFPPETAAGWLLERYLDGPEVSVEVLGHPNAPQALAVHEKPMRQLPDGHFVEIGFMSAPWQLSSVAADRIAREAERLALALGFTRGVANLDMRYTPNGPVLIEFQATPAPGLVASMIERRFPGIDTLELHARSHLHADPFLVALPPPRAATGMRIFYGTQPGPFVVRGTERAREVPGVYAVDVYRERGTLVDPHSEYLGCISAEGDTPVLVAAALDAAEACIAVEPDGDVS